MNNVDKIFLRRNNILFCKLNQSDNKTLVATMLYNLWKYGYTFDNDIIRLLITNDKSYILDVYENVVDIIKKKLGADKEYNPMYPNFPQQVLDMDYSELFINAIIHYIGNVIGMRIMPLYEKEKRLELDYIPKKLNVIQYKNSFTLLKMFKDLLEQPFVYNETDKEDIKNIIDEVGFVSDIKIDKIENKIFYQILTMERGFRNNFLKTATDVLRLAVGLSGGDISLSSNTKFRNFKRSERRYLLNELNKIKNPLEDMKRYRGMWLRLGEHLHPSEKRMERYLNAKKYFDVLRNNEKGIATFNSIVEKKLLNKEIEVISILKKRPGEFARRLNKLLTTFIERTLVIDEFDSIADNLTTSMLFDLIAYFENRNNENIRVFFPKGQVSKLFAIDDNRKELPQENINYLVDILKDVLEDRFSTLPSFPKSFIDETLKDYYIPFSTRSTNDSLNFGRGSKLPVDENIIRTFIWWKDGKTMIDLDLSAVLYDENWNYINHLSYTNLKDDGIQSVHSGDITSAPKGASEFIDINIESAIKDKIRYVVFSVISYTGELLSDVENVVGYMERKDLGKEGEIYEPKTVKFKTEINGNTVLNIPFVLDCVNKKMIYSDVSLTRSLAYSNVENSFGGMTSLGQALVSIQKPTLYDVYKMHVDARSELVEKDDALNIINLETNINDYIK